MIFSRTTFQNFPGISDLLSEVTKFQHHTKLCSKYSSLLVSSLTVSLRIMLFIFYSGAVSLSSSVVHYFVSVVAGHHFLSKRVSTEHNSDGAHGRLCEEIEQVFLHRFPKCH
jgi:hypothetical protein